MYAVEESRSALYPYLFNMDCPVDVYLTWLESGPGAEAQVE
jgi:hypothetical protein